MLETFTSAFGVMLGAVGRIFLVIAVSGILVRLKVITQEQIRGLAKIVVNVLLPCMVFSKITTNFQPDMRFWWMIPMASISMVLLGMGLHYLFYLKTYKQKQSLFPIGSMQNAVYLILPIGKFMYPEYFDEYMIYNFLFLIGFIPILWSVGKVLITGQGFKTVNVKAFLTMPFLTANFTIIITLLGLHNYINPFFMDPIEFVGDATIPLSNIVLGATLGSISLKKLPHWSDIVRITGIKFVLLPVAVIAVLYWINLKEINPVLSNLLVIESAAAPATALILQVRAFGGDKQTVGGIVFISYIICLFAIPFWIAVWQLL